jgi:tRNA (cytosine34-C5)-methyltransferase
MKLHPLYVRIAKRGVTLLKIGGIMTYSTWSFHPIENEAVVVALLAAGCVEILPPKKLDDAGIIYRPGLQHWKVLDDELNELKYDELNESSNKSLPKSL